MNQLDFETKLHQSVYEKYTYDEWNQLLSGEVNVYVYGNGYLGKNFDDIHYKFCGEKEAKEIIENNLYALLRFKYLKIKDNKTINLMEKIVDNFLINIKSILIKISFEAQDQDNRYLQKLPLYCVAFKNGVYDFKNNQWLFKINKIILPNIKNVFYTYSEQYVILWYININFESIGLDLNNVSVKTFYDFFYERAKTKPTVIEPHPAGQSLCFNLVHNMSFNNEFIFDIKKFQHLCEIIGFTLINQFLQYFIMFIGTGSNGKNSLLDGCLSYHLIPKPTSISLDTIEEDRFVSGSFENHYHNFFLESSGKVYKKSEVLKQLTGSSMQSIERKGENRRTGFLNVKHIFSGNEREKVKFNDSTTGFIRRINLYEVFYKWDYYGDYLKLGNFLKTDLSPDLDELKNNPFNTIFFVYLGMLGIFQATKKFTRPFVFTYNDYNTKYENINHAVSEFLTNFNLSDFIKIILEDNKNTDHFIFINGERIYNSKIFKDFFNITNKQNWKNCVNDERELSEFLSEQTVYLNLNILKNYSKLDLSQTAFNSNVEKYTKKTLKSFFNNQNYIQVNFLGERVLFKNIIKKTQTEETNQQPTEQPPTNNQTETNQEITNQESKDNKNDL